MKNVFNGYRMYFVVLSILTFLIIVCISIYRFFDYQTHPDFIALSPEEQEAAIWLARINPPFRLFWIQRFFEPNPAHVLKMREYVEIGGKVSDEDIKFLTYMDNLQNVTFLGSGISSHGFVTLSSLKKLSYLQFESMPLNDDDLKYISNISQLRTLIIKCGRNITDEGVKHLLSLENLEALSISDLVSIDSNGNIMDNPMKITQEGMEILKSHSNYSTMSVYISVPELVQPCPCPTDVRSPKNNAVEVETNTKLQDDIDETGMKCE